MQWIFNRSMVSSVILLLCLGARAGAMPAHAEGAAGSGLLWMVQGSWHHEDGALAQAGEAITPGALLQPDDTDRPHSIVILLPDGQRIYAACSSVADCARGVRVPLLNRAPSAFERSLLDQARSVFAESGLKSGSAKAVPSRTVPAVKDEGVVVLNAAGVVKLTGTAELLPPGEYGCDVEGRGTAAALHQHLRFSKTLAPATVALPAGGLYELRISDATNRPRINLLLAVETVRGPKKFADVPRAREVLEDWSEASIGWPVHDLLRLYLLSLAHARP